MSDYLNIKRFRKNRMSPFIETERQTIQDELKYNRLIFTKKFYRQLKQFGLRVHSYNNSLKLRNREASTFKGKGRYWRIVFIDYDNTGIELPYIQVSECYQNFDRWDNSMAAETMILQNSTDKEINRVLQNLLFLSVLYDNQMTTDQSA